MRPTLVAPITATACAVSVWAAQPAFAQSDTPAICVAPARSEMGSGPDLSVPLRDAVVEGLRAVNARAVALDSGEEGGALIEGAQKGCSYLFLTRVRSYGGSGGGLLQRMSNLKPKIGGLPQRAPTSSDAPPTGSSTQTMTLAAAEQAGIKRGDSVSLEYRLTASRSVNPTKSDKLERKAQADGEDVLTALVARLSSAVAGATIASGDARRSEPQTQAGNGSGDSGRRRGNGSASQNAAPPSAMDCEQMAASSHGTVSIDMCRQMMGLQQAYAAAAADPSASRSGDDTMTCDQIAAEIKQQSFAAPDKAKTAEAQTAMTDLQKTIAAQQKEATELAAKESAEMAAASRLATVSNALAAKAEEKITAEQKATNERMLKEQAPKAERAFNATGAVAADMGQQLAGNPRLARLVQLATQKSCKVR